MKLKLLLQRDYLAFTIYSVAKREFYRRAGLFVGERVLGL